jgi:hypothetical protein
VTVLRELEELEYCVLEIADRIRGVVWADSGVLHSLLQVKLSTRGCRDDGERFLRYFQPCSSETPSFVYLYSQRQLQASDINSTPSCSLLSVRLFDFGTVSITAASVHSYDLGRTNQQILRPSCHPSESCIHQINQP